MMKIQNRQANYFSQNCKVHTAFPFMSQHYNNTITKKETFFLFSNNILITINFFITISISVKIFNSYIKVELAEEHSHKEITQEKEQETEENSFLDKSENISELRKFKTTTSEKNPKDTWLHKKNHLVQTLVVRSFLVIIQRITNKRKKQLLEIKETERT